MLYDHQGHYAKAEPLYKRSLAIAEKSLGPTTFMLLSCSANITPQTTILGGRYR